MPRTDIIGDDQTLAEELARLAGNVIQPYFRRVLDIENKEAAVGGYDPVTVADKAAEDAIVAAIRRHRPEDAIAGEESGHHAGTSGRTWVIDPIDGTRAFIAGMPTWGTLVGLEAEGRAIAGAAMQPVVGDSFTGGPRGAFLNSVAVKTRRCTGLEGARLATTDPALFTPAERQAFAEICDRAAVCRLGGDWYPYALLAAGHFDVVIESGLKAHDVMALIAIIEAAGGRIVTWRGGPCLDGGQVLAVGDPRLLDPALALLAPAAA